MQQRFTSEPSIIRALQHRILQPDQELQLFRELQSHYLRARHLLLALPSVCQGKIGELEGVKSKSIAICRKEVAQILSDADQHLCEYKAGKLSLAGVERLGCERALRLSEVRVVGEKSQKLLFNSLYIYLTLQTLPHIDNFHQFQRARAQFVRNFGEVLTTEEAVNIAPKWLSPKLQDAIVFQQLKKTAKDPEESSRLPASYAADVLEALLETRRDLMDRVNEALSSNLKLIQKIANQYAGLIYRMPIDYEDLFGHGVLVFPKAALSFNPDRNLKFSTYLTRVLRNDFSRYIESFSPMSSQQRKLSAKLSALDDEFRKYKGMSASVEELAAQVNLAPAKVAARLGSRGAATVIRFSELEGPSGHRLNGMSRGGSPSSALEYREMDDALAASVQKLTAREKEILRLRFLTSTDQGKGHTLVDISRVVGITKQRVSQILIETLTKLRQSAADE